MSRVRHPTAYKWIKGYDEVGPEGLLDLTRTAAQFTIRNIRSNQVTQQYSDDKQFGRSDSRFPNRHEPKTSHGNGGVWKAWKAMKPAFHPSHTSWKCLRGFPHYHGYDDDNHESEDRPGDTTEGRVQSRATFASRPLIKFV